jgi:cyanophycinase
MELKKIVLSFSLLMTMALITVAQEASEEVFTTGPEKGALVIMGGGTPMDGITNKFIELAGGYDAPIVVVPTAAGRKSYDENGGWVAIFRKAGATNVTMLHTTDKETADSKAFIEPLKNAKGVWFGGGRQWRLVDAYQGTKTEKVFWEILNNGGVVGGTSAGATIQGSFLARGDTKNNQIMMGDHQEGLSFIKNIAIDQHVIARNRQFDMFDILKEKPDLLGISIDESTAVVVKGNKFEVIGKSYVIIYDGTFWSREGSKLKNLPSKDNLFYYLKEGDEYDMKQRKVLD